MNSPDPAPLAPATYTPGYRMAKLVMLAAGLLIIAFALTELWEPLRLAFFGKHVVAETVRVIKEKPGADPIEITDNAQLQSQLESKDRGFIFWNEFEFHTAEGNIVRVRAPVGSQLKPLYPLIGVDGLPTTDLVFYDPKHPEQAIFPLIISTWLAPAVLLLVGIVCAIVARALYYWADKPIELPHISPHTPGPERQ
jgi:hypothetical protein